MRAPLPRLLPALGTAAVLMAAAGLHAADHRDAPALMDSMESGPADINDLYAFQSPQTPANTVLIVTVNPFAGILSPTQFGSGISYDIEVDQDGDAAADLVYRTRFVNFGTRSLAFVNRLRKHSSGAFRSDGIVGFGFEGETIPLDGGGKMTFGLYDDPFFFDLLGFRSGFEFTGDDFFAGANVDAIVLEVPSAELIDGGNTVGVNARTLEGLGVVSRPTQIDRVGRPAINTVLVPSARKDAFNVTRPGRDAAQFRGNFVASIENLNGGQTQKARDLTAILLPDLLTVDVTSPAGFLNGRRLEDDVIDAELDLLSDGGVTTDMVDSNDRPFRQVFPYLAAPQ